MNLIFLRNTVSLSQRIPVDNMYLEDLPVREEIDVPVSLVFSKGADTFQFEILWLIYPVAYCCWTWETESRRWQWTGYFTYREGLLWTTALEGYWQLGASRAKLQWLYQHRRDHSTQTWPVGATMGVGAPLATSCWQQCRKGQCLVFCLREGKTHGYCPAFMKGKLKMSMDLYAMVTLLFKNLVMLLYSFMCVCLFLYCDVGLIECLLYGKQSDYKANAL